MYCTVYRQSIYQNNVIVTHNADGTLPSRLSELTSHFTGQWANDQDTVMRETAPIVKEVEPVASGSMECGSKDEVVVTKEVATSEN